MAVKAKKGGRHAVPFTSLIRLEVEKIFTSILNIDIKKVDINSSLDKLGIESFEAKLILVAIEERFKITVDPEEVSQLKTFNDILQLIEKCVGKKKNR